MADVVQVKILARDTDNTIDPETTYNELNTKANALAEDLVVFAEAAVDDVDTVVAAGEAARDAAQATREAVLQAKVDDVMSVNPDGTYYTKGAIDNKNALMTAAEFEALAAKRRDEYAGSGFVEWGKHYNNLTNRPNVNEGVWTNNPDFVQVPNKLFTGYPLNGSENGISNTASPVINVNGYRLHVGYIGLNDDYNAISLPSAPATSALLDRQDLAFLEVWHEDISEKGIVYPYGNTQCGATSYVCPNGTSLTCAAGTFTGNGTYSLFGNWQSSGNIVGKGIVWDDLTDAQKQSFAADPQNNLYLDGNKIIQVRYRIRVIEGLGSVWGNVNPTITRFQYDSTHQVRVKGKATTIDADLGTSADYYEGPDKDAPAYDTSLDRGMWQGLDANWAYKTDLAYSGRAYALPICLVHRRNSGAFHPVWNPNGTRVWVKNVVDAGPWYESNINAPSSVSDAFNILANDSLGTSAVGAYVSSGAIGDVIGTGRPDGLCYDEINEADILDLRNSAHKVEDYRRLLEREFNKCVAGGMRGWEKESFAVTGALDDAIITTSYLYLSQTKPAWWDAAFELYGVDVAAGYEYAFVVAKGAKYKLRCLYYSATYDRYGFRLAANHGLTETDAGIEVTANLHGVIPSSSKTPLHCDIIGDPVNYPQEWQDNGVMGTPLLVDEDGNSIIPGTDWVAGTEIKLSRKAVTSPVLQLYSDNLGVSWNPSSIDFDSAKNSMVFGGTQNSSRIYMWFYLTEASPLELADTTEVLALGNAWACNHYNGINGVNLVTNLISKVPVGNRFCSAPLKSYAMNEDTFSLVTGARQPINGDIPTLGETSVNPAVKALPYLSRENGKAFLQLLYKEMIYDSTWGDDSKFNVVDNESTITDDNGNIVKIGQKRIELPYFISDGE